jgi:hypothetical protein
MMMNVGAIEVSFVAAALNCANIHQILKLSPVGCRTKKMRKYKPIKNDFPVEFRFSSKEISFETREGKFSPVTYEIIIMENEKKCNSEKKKTNYDFSHF